ncbi:MAG: phage holin family protein [Blastocatellia bacterium]|nr:phage holin family protein [Blastocatellia bacterium]
MIEGRSSIQRESIGDLLSNLAGQTTELVRDEIALIGREYYEKAKILRPALIVLAAGAFLAMLASVALCAAIVLVMSRFMDTWLSAAITGGVLGAIAVMMLIYSVSRLKQTNLKPEQTLRSLKENKEWLKEIT